MSTDRLVCGLAVPFDEPSVDREFEFRREHLERFVELGGGLPLMFSHGPTITSRSVVPTIGRGARFALLDASPPIPAGVLALARVDDGPYGDAVLDEIRGGRITGLSLRCGLVYDDAGALDMVWPTELSLCHDPRFDRARIIATGKDALSAWELLTGQPVKASAAT